MPVTFWFDPSPEVAGPVRIRLSGQRIGVVGRPKASDRFERELLVKRIVPGSGPVSVTARIRGVEPGEWRVRGKLIPDRAAARSDGGARKSPARRDSLYRAGWSWRRWRLSEAPATPVRSCPVPFALAPGLIVCGWVALVAVGIAVALVVQACLLSAEDLSVTRGVVISLPAIVAGAVGAKLWFVILHRRDGQRDGWCIQGLVAGVIVVAPPLLLALGMPTDVFLDATAPGLMFGLAIGRIGCFFAGCCTGRPTGSRFGIWSANRHGLGVRRIPTQLMESALALVVGLAALAVVIVHGTVDGAVFVAAIAAYTLARQGILRVREEARDSKLGLPLTAAAAAAVVLAVAGTLIAVTP